jgi:hypothetical protein
LLSAAVVVLGLAWLSVTVASAADPDTGARSLEVGAFRHLRVAGHVEIVLVQGSREAVEVDPAVRAEGRLRVRNEPDGLTIAAEDTRPWWGFLRGPQRPVRVLVHFRTLESIAVGGAVRVTTEAMKVDDLLVQATGAANLRLEGLEATAFTVHGSGAVEAKLAGRVGRQEVRISGAGTFLGPDFVSERADVGVSGAGRVVVHATRELDASISGVGTIDYYGSPQVRERISGAGRIKRLSGDGAAEFAHVASAAVGR